MPKPTCSIDGCESPVLARGWCGKHYKRWEAHGDPTKLITQVDRFWANVEKSDGCWTWTGGKRAGYGRIRFDGRGRQAHRVSLLIHGTPVDDELDVDHRCGNRACVRPEHLRVATRKQNLEHLTVLRSDNTSGYRGVSPRRGRWTARVSHNKTVYLLGDFDTPEEAAEAARKKRNELYTHNDLDRIA